MSLAAYASSGSATQQFLARKRHRPFASIHTTSCNAKFSSVSTDAAQSCQTDDTSRRNVLISGTATASLIAAWPASAIGFRKELKRRGARPVEDYSEGAEGLKTLDLAEGSGTPVKQGDLVTVHFDSIFKGIDVASSRSARLLGGNRTISEPLSFTAGKELSLAEKQAGESAGGLFSGQSGPKPPPALSKAVIGMKPGGKRSVLVPPELGYGQEGLLEIPPGATIELRIEVLSIGGS